MSTTVSFTDAYNAYIDAIQAGIGQGSIQWSAPWNNINSGNLTLTEFNNVMESAANNNPMKYQRLLNADGSVRGYTYVNSTGNIAGLNFDDVLSGVNSNYQSGASMASYSEVANTAINAGTQAVETAGTLAKLKAGVQTTGNFVTGKVLPAVLAVSTGIQLGKAIDGTLYNLFPDFWDSHGMGDINPEKWSAVTSNSDNVGTRLFNMLFDVNDKQAYMEADAMAYLAAYMYEMGVFDTGQYDYTGVTYYSSKPALNTLSSSGTPVQIQGWGTKYYGANVRANMMIAFYANFANCYLLGLIAKTAGSYYQTLASSVSSNSYTGQIRDSNNVLFYVSSTFYNLSGVPDYRMLDIGTYTGTNNYSNVIAWINSQTANIDINSIIGTSGSGGGVDGITDQPGAVIPDFSTITDAPNQIPQILNIINTTYPELAQNAVTNDVVQPDGTTKTYTYYPVTLPASVNDTLDNPNANIQPVSYVDDTPQGQSNWAVDDSIAELILTLLSTLASTDTEPKGMYTEDTSTDDPLPTTPNTTDTGDGTSPTVVMPTGNASRLWSVYNPSQAEVDAFGAWLWSSNFIEQIKKLFVDPMTAIIGIHKIFATPVISQSKGTIVCGYIDSQVSSNLVTEQYTTVDCGTIDLFEYFGNVFDYEDTEVSVYLPFIGIHQLDTSFVMRSSINILYHVDVYTGACLAEIRISRDGFAPIIYTFSGDCSVRYPLSSGSYMGIVSGILTAGAALLSGGVGGVIGGAMALSNSHTNVQKSGSLQGNTGAMGCKKPYIIISRPQVAMTDFPHYQGYGSNTMVSVGALHGYFKLTDVDVQHVSSATGEELLRIKTLLEQGVHMTG